MDIRTLFMALAVGMGVSTAVLFYLHWLRFPVRGTFWWAAGNLSLTVCLVLVLFRGLIPDALSIVLANTLLFYGYAFLWHGIRLFLDRPGRPLAMAGFPLAGLPLLYWFTYRSPSLTYRAAGITLFMAAWAAALSHELLRGEERLRVRWRRWFGWFNLVEAVFYVSWALSVLCLPQQADLLSAGAHFAVLYMADLGFVVLQTTGLVMMIGEQLWSRQRASREAAEVHASELDAIVDAMAEGLVVIGKDGSTLRVNDAAVAIFGFSDEERVLPPAERMRPFEILNPDGTLQELGEMPAYRALRGETVRNVVCQYRREGRTPFWVSVTAAPVRDGAGEILGSVTTFRDVTKHLLAEAALRESEERFRTFADNVPAPLWITDTDHRFVFLNGAYERLFGVRLAEVEGKTCQGLFPEEHITPYRDQVRQALETDAAVESEVSLSQIDGGARLWRRLVFPIRTQAGDRLIGGVGIDITALRRLELEARQAQRAAEAANKAKSVFLANMSHEIRTPMNGVLGMTELALMADIPPRAREFLTMARRSAKALLDIIGDILDLSKIEAGREELLEADFSLRQTFDQVVGALAVEADRKGLALICNLDPVVPDGLRGDQGKLRQVLVNLVANGIKFTPRGEVVVSATSLPPPPGEGTGRSRLLLAVRDTGIGIPEDRLETIFESFFQVHAGPTEGYGGTGLGLAISRQLVEMMGGRLWAESTPGRGSTFFCEVALEPAGENRMTGRGMGRTEVG